MDISSIGKKKKEFRKDQLQRNVLPWLALLLLCGAWFGLSLAGGWLDWLEKSNVMAESDKILESLEAEVEQKQGEKDTVQVEFDTLSEGIRNKELQQFPETIDTSKVAKILEFYALTLENLDDSKYDSHFQLEKLRFSNPIRVGKGSSARNELKASMEVSTDKRNLETFVNYLQTGTLASRLSKAEIIDPKAYLFLKENTLPIANIDSVKILPATSEEETALGRIRAQMNIVFFAR